MLETCAWIVIGAFYVGGRLAVREYMESRRRRP
jgi:hypothetical protein